MNDIVETPKASNNIATSKNSINNTKTEMKYSKGSQIVHHLDSNIKRTIFFDPLRDESDFTSPLGLVKTQSVHQFPQVEPRAVLRRLGTANDRRRDISDMNNTLEARSDFGKDFS
jgi:hypothetical protein